MPDKQKNAWRWFPVLMVAVSVILLANFTNTQAGRQREAINRELYHMVSPVSRTLLSLPELPHKERALDTMRLCRLFPTVIMLPQCLYCFTMTCTSRLRLRGLVRQAGILASWRPSRLSKPPPHEAWIPVAPRPSPAL